MTLNFISSDALARGGPLHYTFMGQMLLSLLSPCFFFLLPTPLSTSLYLSLMLMFNTSVRCLQKQGLCRPQSEAVFVAFDLAAKCIQMSALHKVPLLFSV